jgi:hypothetical protein
MSNPKKRRVSLQTALDVCTNDNSDWFDSEGEDELEELDYSDLMDSLTIAQDNIDDSNGECQKIESILYNTHCKNYLATYYVTQYRD